MSKKIALILVVLCILSASVYAECAEGDFSCKIKERLTHKEDMIATTNTVCDQTDYDCRLSALEEENADLKDQLEQQNDAIDFIFEMLDFIICDSLDLCEEEIACYDHSDCEEIEWPEEVNEGQYCEGDAVVEDEQVPVCNNPGISNSFCSVTVSTKVVEECEYGCENAQCLPPPGDGIVIFRTNIENGDYYNKIRNAWIVVDRNSDEELEPYGIRARSSWHNSRCSASEYCSDSAESPCIIVVTPTDDKVVDYGNDDTIVVCDELNHKQVFYKKDDSDADDAELSAEPKEPFSSNNQEVRASGDPWQELPDFPLEMANLIAGVVDGKLYAGQGASQGFNNGRFYEFDFGEMQWTQKSMPSDIYDRASVVYDNKLYAFGGVEHGGPLSISHEYDPQTNVWTQISSMPVTRVGVTSGDVVETKAYVMGGGILVGPQSGATVNYAYDFVTKTWAKMADMPRGRLGHASAAVGDKIYLFGGVSATGGAPHVNEIDVYDASSNSWSTLSVQMPKELSSLVVLPINGKIYLFGGSNHGIISDAVYEFDPQAESFTEKTSMPSKRYQHAGAVKNGVAYLVGGTNDNAVTAYTPSLD